MNLNFSVEEFLEEIEKAKRLIPKKPTIVVKNATVTGVKLNSKVINSIPKSEEPISFYEGINVYQDDSLDKPRFIVEGEIEKKNYLKWEDLEFESEYKTLNVKMGESIYKIEYFKYVSGFVRFYIAEDKVITLSESRKQFFNDLHLEVIE